MGEALEKDDIGYKRAKGAKSNLKTFGIFGSSVTFVTFTKKGGVLIYDN